MYMCMHAYACLCVFIFYFVQNYFKMCIIFSRKKSVKFFFLLLFFVRQEPEEGKRECCICYFQRVTS